MAYPFSNRSHHRDNPYGSSRFGNEQDAQQLSQGRGAIAQMANTVLRFDEKQPSVIFGGAGSGKFGNIGGYFVSHPTMRNKSAFYLDMGAQFMSTSWHWNIAENRHAYALNVEDAGAYPYINHLLNLWGILKNDPFLFDNVRRIAAMALKNNGKGDDAWVYDDAVRWLSRLLIALVQVNGRATPKDLWVLLNAMDADDEVIKQWGRAVEGLPYDLHTTFVEIYRVKTTSEKQYAAVMGKLKSDLDWLSSPKVADSISGDEDYLAYLSDPNKKVGIYYVLRGGSGKIMESLTRMVVGIAMLHCMRNVSGALPTFYLEEAATCGGADFIKQAVSESRKYFHTILVYQSPGQPLNLFGRAGAQEIMESCGQHIYLGGGIRDFDSAQKVADSIGKTTILVDDPMAQSDRVFKAEKAWRDSLMHGSDMMEAAERFEHEHHQSSQGRYNQRYVIDPAELMRLKNEVVILSPGSGAPPLLAQKLPNYWENPAMAGRYAPDPLFPPLDRVNIKRKHFWGSKTRRFIRTEVPAHLADMPNHINGEIAYVEGYRTW